MTSYDKRIARLHEKIVDLEVRLVKLERKCGLYDDVIADAPPQEVPSALRKQLRKEGN
jgi:hypothetical protein